jgi:peptidoglycan-associated lipoprotein
MNILRTLPWPASLVCAALAIGCGGSKPPAASPSSESARAPAPPSPPATASQSTTSSNVAISDEIRTKCGIRDADAYFPFDSSRITTTDRTPLDQVVQCLTRGPLKGRSLKLVGRADPRGPTDYNMTLGESRADAVATYLGSRGMARDKAVATSRGSMDAQGIDERGWQRDRRVDVLLGD